MVDLVRKKILLVDDSELIRQVYIDKLEEAGYAVETAADGKNGLATMKDFQPDLLLLDMFMPKMTGFELVEKVQQDPQLSHIPIIAFSDVRVDHEDLIKKGVRHVLLKGEVEPAQVTQVINEIIGLASVDS
jgi:CheY-like chemotaxis protein